MEELYYIFDGKCGVKRNVDSQFTSSGYSNKFGKDRVLGDFLFLTGKEPISQHDIEVLRPSTILAINLEKLKELIKEDKEIGDSLYFLFASEMVNKLHIDDIYGDKLRSFRKKIKFLNVRNKITKKEKAFILELREKIDLDMKYFVRELDRVGWNIYELENRVKVTPPEVDEDNDDEEHHNQVANYHASNLAANGHLDASSSNKN